MRKLLLLSLLCLFGCDSRSPEQIKIDKAKIVFKETMYHIKNPSFIDEQSKVDGNKVSLMVVYVGTDTQTHSQLVDVYVIEKENEE